MQDDVVNVKSKQELLLFQKLADAFTQNNIHFTRTPFSAVSRDLAQDYNLVVVGLEPLTFYCVPASEPLSITALQELSYRNTHKGMKCHSRLGHPVGPLSKSSCSQ